MTSNFRDSTVYKKKIKIIQDWYHPFDFPICMLYALFLVKMIAKLDRT